MELADATIAIMGLGLMGGSLALALKGKCCSLRGMDVDAETLAYATDRGIVDIASSDLESILAGVDVLILAMPVGQIVRFIQDLPKVYSGKIMLMDLGSTKADIVNAMSKLPKRFDVLGGHPMCGKEKLGIQNADPTMFSNAPFAFTKLENTSPKAVDFANQLVAAIGANPLWISGEIHDAWTAATSHFPYLISTLLARVTPAAARPLIGSGYRSATRLAGTPASLMLDVCLSNHENILAAFDHFVAEMQQLRELLAAQDADALRVWMDKAATHQNHLLGQSTHESHH
ncbi:MAG: prephenate dehydrogenase [Anaerolineales bacterium]|nr:prephenate dehydrogenase [Anaerolineales bacterium]